MLAFIHLVLCEVPQISASEVFRSALRYRLDGARDTRARSGRMQRIERRPGLPSTPPPVEHMDRGCTAWTCSRPRPSPISSQVSLFPNAYSCIGPYESNERPPDNQYAALINAASTESTLTLLTTLHSSHRDPDSVFRRTSIHQHGCHCHRRQEECEHLQLL